MCSEECSGHVLEIPEAYCSHYIDLVTGVRPKTQTHVYWITEEVLSVWSAIVHLVKINKMFDPINTCCLLFGAFFCLVKKAESLKLQHPQ